MAFLVKSQNVPRSTGATGNNQALLSQYIQVSFAAAVLPQTTSAILFRTFGGRILVHLLYGEVTTIMTATDPGLSFLSKRLDNAGVAVGTAVTIASTANLASKEVGANVTVLGSGAAFIINNAGVGIATLGRVEFVVPQGELYVTTTGSNTTGQMKFDMWYQPLDAGAYVVAQPAATAII